MVIPAFTYSLALSQIETNETIDDWKCQLLVDCVILASEFFDLECWCLHSLERGEHLDCTTTTSSSSKSSNSSSTADDITTSRSNGRGMKKSILEECNWSTAQYRETEKNIFMVMDFCLFPRNVFEC